MDILSVLLPQAIKTSLPGNLAKLGALCVFFTAIPMEEKGNKDR